jgi:hypothetical protein
MSSGDQYNKGYEILDAVAAQALDDDDYLQALIDDPVSVLRDAGMDVADNVTVVIHQNTPDTVHLVLPSIFQTGQKLDVDDVDLQDVTNCIHF